MTRWVGALLTRSSSQLSRRRMTSWRLRYLVFTSFFWISLPWPTIDSKLFLPSARCPNWKPSKASCRKALPSWRRNLSRWLQEHCNGLLEHWSCWMSGERSRPCRSWCSSRGQHRKDHWRICCSSCRRKGTIFLKRCLTHLSAWGKNWLATVHIGIFESD